jgi:hypothetical protein
MSNLKHQIFINMDLETKQKLESFADEYFQQYLQDFLEIIIQKLVNSESEEIIEFLSSEFLDEDYSPFIDALERLYQTKAEFQENTDSDQFPF